MGPTFDPDAPPHDAPAVEEHPDLPWTAPTGRGKVARVRRHTWRGVIVASAASVLVHLTLTGGVVWYARHVQPASSESRAVSAVPPVRPQEVEPETVSPLGLRDAEADALAQFDSPDPLQATRAGSVQPHLGVTDPGPDVSAEQAWQALASEAVPTLPATDLEALLLALDTSEPTAEQAALPASVPVPPVPPAEPVPAPVPESATASAGDPGASARREMDLFGPEASLELSAGGTEAKAGRDFRIRGIRRGLVAYFDAALLPRPITLEFVIEVDPAGVPVRVDVKKSSGSAALDQNLRTALFNGGWFDPDPDGTGAAVGKPFVFPVRIQ